MFLVFLGTNFSFPFFHRLSLSLSNLPHTTLQVSWYGSCRFAIFFLLKEQHLVDIAAEASHSFHIIASATPWQANSFVLGLLCYRWLSFCNNESSLHKVFIWFLLIVCFCFFFGLCPLVFSFALYFWWMGSYTWFLFTRFFFQICKDKLKRTSRFSLDLILLVLETKTWNTFQIFSMQYSQSLPLVDFPLK
jgi:hypothetical protein